MTPVGAAFERARAESRSCLVIYVCGGDPTLKATADLLLEVQESGADVVELGVPFSDPTADGPTIQAASRRALDAGATFRGVLDSLKEARGRGFTLPVVLFGYYNPILAYGEGRAIADARDAGVSAFLVVDLPVEEATSFVGALRAEGLSYVPLVAPTSGDARARAAAAVADDFIYYVSKTGVTGTDAPDLAVAASRAKEVEAIVHKPVAVGFGIAEGSHVREVRQCSGVVVGSALIRAHQAGRAGELVRELRAATPH
ncbi:MAG: tryptophan synthase subunit alpha [Myxococcota bacterium]